MAISSQEPQSTPSTLDSRWHRTREESDAPSEPSTPAASRFHNSDSRDTSRSRAGSTSIGQPAAYNIDAEDEDVKIAIMALGAMKHLDGSSRSRSRSAEDPSRHIERISVPKQNSSSRSVSSTAISSPSSSTLATDQTIASSSASTSSSTPATLADLPADFQFPAIVFDESGNEVRVEKEDMADADFLKRVSHLPIVRGTLRAYELGKQHSRVMRYGGGLVESSVKAISRPVVSRIGARLGDRGVEQLDDFACRQLDRIYPYAANSVLTKEEKEEIMAEIDEKDQTEWKDMSEEERSKRKKAYIALKAEEKERARLLRDSAASNAKMNGSNGGGVVGSLGRSASYTGNLSPPSTQQLQRDRSTSDAQRQALIRAHSDQANSRPGGWSSMLVEAGVTAGGLSAAMSEESMKSLKYCLQWLQYATAHIEHQITILRDLIVKLNHGELDLTSPAAENLSNIKRDVVVTIRNVVDVVGKYAGGALPEPARASVKAFILSLPARWATVNRATSTVESRQGAFGNSPASPSFSSIHMSDSINGGNSSSSSNTDNRPASINAIARQQAAATAVAANRVLTLAVESLDILRSVTVVFGESLDRADLWVERLRVLGLQRKRAHEQAAAEEAAARIDVGMGGVLARGPSYWESMRGMPNSGSQSPGAESNMSIGTTASSKRRRVKRRGTLRNSSSPVLGVDDEREFSDEGSSTETENAKLNAPALGRSVSASGHSNSLTSSVHHHFQHPHGPTMSQRRSHAGSIGSKGKNHRFGVSKTPPSGSTPLLQELTLRDRSESLGSRSDRGGRKNMDRS